MHWLLLLFSQLVFAFFTSVLLCTFMVTWQFMLQQFQSPWPKLLGKFSGTPWRQCALSSCRRKLLVKCVNLFVGRRAQCARLFKWLCSHLIPEHWCLVLNLKMCLFRHWVTTFTQSDAVLKHKHRYVKQWTVGRAPKNARMFTTHRTEARLNAQIQRVEFVISRALLLFCSGSLSGNETSFSASKPCWNSVTEMNVYRVFLVSNFMVFSFVSFKAIPLVLV